MNFQKLKFHCTRSTNITENLINWRREMKLMRQRGGKCQTELLKKRKVIFQKIMDETLPELMKDMNLQLRYPKI